MPNMQLEKSIFKFSKYFEGENVNPKITLIIRIIACSYCFLYQNEVVSSMPIRTSSPDNQLQVYFEIDSQGKALYSIRLSDKIALEPSQLGLNLDKKSFAEKLTLESASDYIIPVEPDQFSLIGLEHIRKSIYLF